MRGTWVKKGTGVLDIWKDTVTPEELKQADSYSRGEIELPKQKILNEMSVVKQLPEKSKDIPSKQNSNNVKRTAIPTTTPPSSLGPRAAAATKENQNLAGPSAKSSAPVIVNKTTNVVNNGGVSGGSGGGGRVRNDEAVLTRLQFQNVRPV